MIKKFSIKMTSRCGHMIIIIIFICFIYRLDDDLLLDDVNGLG